MMLPHPYAISPLGDAALVVDFGNIIDVEINRRVLLLHHQVQRQQHPAIIDAVPAYASLAIFYDVEMVATDEKSAFEVMAEWIERLPAVEPSMDQDAAPVTRIPVCYDPILGHDIDEMAGLFAIPVEKIIELHTAKPYRVFMTGFMPGFAYLGEVDEKIAFPRKANPRARVEAGSVGIAGRQTGIYPLPSPGGWQIIGRTPVKTFDISRPDMVLLKPGGQVQFYPITIYEFENYKAGIS